jgi:hypothetical protein
MIQNFRSSVARVGLFVLAVLLFTVSGLAQQTLGSLNGTVTDPTGAAVPGATVTANDAAINVTSKAITSGTGSFQIFNLPIGTYTITVTRDGFETSKLEKIPVQEARATTVNPTLKVGQASESVTVTSTPLLNATDATNGYTLDASQIEITPLATGSFTQLAILSPGVNAELLANLDTNSGLGNQPIWANGQRDTDNTFQVDGVDSTNLFNGKSSSGSASQRINFNIGTDQSAGGEHTVGTSVYGSNGNSLPSPPPEFTQELRVNASMYDAQQGATSGAQIDVNTSTGTNTWHGGLYGTYANNLINAAPFFFNQQYQLATEGVGTFPQSMANPFLRRWTAGATAGGPIKKDKLFLFVAYQLRSNEDQATGFSQFTVPTALTDDRTNTGLSNAAAVWGATVAPSAIDPIASALFNAKLPNGSFLIPSAQSSAPYQYGVSNVNLIGTAALKANQGTISLDYDVSPSDRLSTKYFYQNAPVTKPYGFSQTGGFPMTQNNGAQVVAIDNTKSIGSRLNWEQRLGFVREGSYTYFTQTLAGGNLGVNGTPTDPTNADGSAAFQGGLPGITIKEFADNDQYSPSLGVGPYSSFVNMGYYQNRINPSSNLIFTAGKHTIVAGGGYSFTQLNIDNNRDGIAEVNVSSFSNLLKGKVKSSDVIESEAHGHNNADRYYRNNEASAYVQDKWQIQPSLSLTLGARYDYHGGLTEKYGNMFNFDGSLYNVTGTSTTGFTVNNAGFIVAGNNKYSPSAGVSDSTLTGRQWGISPRLGFAWSPTQNHGKVVFSGGAGMYYDRGELFSYLSEPAGGSIGGPFGATMAAPLVSYINGTGTHLDDPLGGAIAAAIPPSPNPQIITQTLQTQLNQMTGQSKYYGPNCGGVDNQEGYLDCTATIYFGAYDRKNVLPYTINYTLNFQWQPTSDTSFTLGYAGNRGRHAVMPIPANEPGIATPNNPIWGETSTYGFEVLNQNSSSDGYDYDPIPGEPWNTNSGGNTDFRAPYVGYNPSATFFKTAGVSAYDALETHLEKRLSHNFQLGASYTWSHALDEQSDIGLFFTGNDPSHLRDSWASSDFDRTNVFSANFQVVLPNAAKEHSLGSYVTNGWHLTGIGILQSGEPYSLYEFYGAVGSINFGNYPNLANPVLGIKNPGSPKKAMTGNPGKFRAGSSYLPTLDPSQISIDYLSPGVDGIPTSPSSQPSDIYETNWNKGERNIFRQSGQKRVDLSLRKTFKFTEKLGLQYEFNAFNITNTTSLDIPQDQAQIRQNDACSDSANAVSYNNCALGYVNYGQIVTSNSSVDQLSAKHNLDQIPYTTGTGKGIQAPTTIPIGTTDANGVVRCVAYNAISTSQGCPNNAANFGSVTGAIGGSRAFTMGMHLTF